ncbi:Uncharacterised protein [Klebsiella pneumoniae]|uniref:Uncharacterized protein n=1 Tax=Klebsiella pneumoniae TaxID=573 RepID=A0A377VWK0_KLEPN|nr:Uncharacterised protein [Klebsiella pneumoniae]
MVIVLFGMQVRCHQCICLDDSFICGQGNSAGNTCKPLFGICNSRTTFSIHKMTDSIAASPFELLQTLGQRMITVSFFDHNKPYLTESANRPCRTEILFLKQFCQSANLFQPQHFILLHAQLSANALICPTQTRKVSYNIRH